MLGVSVFLCVFYIVWFGKGLRTGASFAEDSVVVLNDTASVIQGTCIPYLKAYFDHQETESDFPVAHSGLFSRDAGPLSAFSAREMIRAKLTMCLYLIHARFEAHQNVYRVQAREASKVLHTREDDALRMFFYGHLVICTQQMNASFPLTALLQGDSIPLKNVALLKDAEPSSRLSASLGLSVADLNQLFYWRASLATTLPPEVAAILKDLVRSTVNYGRAGVVQSDLLTPFTAEKAPLLNFGIRRVTDAAVLERYFGLLRSHPFSLLEGPDGVMWTCTLVAVVLGIFAWVNKPSRSVKRPAASEHHAEPMAKCVRRSSGVEDSVPTRKKKARHG